MSREYNNWHNGQTTIAIPKETHERLKQLRDAYRAKHRRNVCLGDLIEMLLDDDPVIEGLKPSRRTVANGEQND